MLCYDTDSHQIVKVDGVHVRDVQLLAPLLIGVRAHSGNGEIHAQLNGGNITKRNFKPELPDESKKTA